MHKTQLQNPILTELEIGKKKIIKCLQIWNFYANCTDFYQTFSAK